MRIGRTAVLTAARRTNSNGVGAALRRHSSPGSGAGASGVTSLRALVISSSVTPSIAAWWIFVIMAKLPAGSPAMASRPSMTYISHSGRLRSRGRECNRAIWMQN